MTVVVTTATEAELGELADVAAQTFPLACPPTVTADNIAAFVAANLSAAAVRRLSRRPGPRGVRRRNATAESSVTPC